MTEPTAVWKKNGSNWEVTVFDQSSFTARQQSGLLIPPDNLDWIYDGAP